MKHKIFFLFVFAIFLLMGCNKDKITLNIITPKDGQSFKIYEDIEVNVTANTKKGSITQVVLDVNADTILYLTKAPYDFAPYDFLVPCKVFKDTGFFYLNVLAYSSEGVQEGKAINIKIEE